MKKKRTIRIKNPCLKRVRDQLRVVLQLTVVAQVRELLEKKKVLQGTEGFWSNTNPDFADLNAKYRELNSRENKLGFVYNSSIVFCPVCRSIDRDMTYNPVCKKWFCTECYNSNQEFEITKGRPELYP